MAAQTAIEMNISAPEIQRLVKAHNATMSMPIRTASIVMSHERGNNMDEV